jgi:hypothetical protein
MRALAAGLAVALVALGILGGKLWRDLKAQRAANQALVAGMVIAAPEQGAPSSGAPASGVPPQQGVVLPGSQPASPPATPSGAAAADAAMAEMMQATRAYLDTPEGREFQRVIARQQLQQQYRDVGEKLGLSAAEVDKLLDMIVGHQLAESAIQLEMMSGAQGAARDDIFRRLADTQRTHSKELQDLLGEKFPRLQEYRQEANSRQRQDMLQRQSQELRAAVTSSGRLPMTDAQFEALSTALREEEQRFDREYASISPQQMLGVLDERTRRMGEAAAVHLNSDQLAQYQAYLQEQAEMMRATLGMLGGAAGAAGN